MKQKMIWLTVGILTLVVLGAGAFTATQLLATDSSDGDIPAGAIVFEDVFDDGSGNPVTVKTIIEPAAELPNRPAEAAGVLVKQEDNSYFVGTGSISVNIQVVDGVASTAVDHSGPEIEVVIGRDTVFYRDVTEFETVFTESTEQRLTQKVELIDERPQEIAAGANFSAWGTQSGDRVIADVVVFSPPR